MGPFGDYFSQVRIISRDFLMQLLTVQPNSTGSDIKNSPYVRMAMFLSGHDKASQIETQPTLS